jgi:hypothetical protein
VASGGGGVCAGAVWDGSIVQSALGAWLTQQAETSHGLPNSLNEAQPSTPPLWKRCLRVEQSDVPEQQQQAGEKALYWHVQQP